MATPTPGRPTTVAATPPVSTPFSQTHLTAFSPRGPRSLVHSPQQFKKSPANSQTVYGHPTSSGLTPGNSFGGAMNFDSPTAQAALANMPTLTDADLAAAGVAGMGLGVGGLGSRQDEDEKRRKLQMIIDILKVNKGRVSEEGVERLARRIGFECLWEDQMGMMSNGKAASRTLVIAGSGLSIDIDFANNLVQKVAMSFLDGSKNVTRHERTGSLILLRDLQIGPDESPLTKMLDRFAVNLERLAALDKLSVLPALNCHEAIAGIYESLLRLHQWEIKNLKEEENMAAESDEKLATISLCSKSGRPIMNIRGQVGLSLDYWQEKRHIGMKATDPVREVEPKTWSMTVECAPSSSLAYSSVRVTDKWIADEIEKSDPGAEDLLSAMTGRCLNWQNPEAVLVQDKTSAKGDVEMDGMESLGVGNQKLPDVMFVAKFNPPLMVPYATAMNIYMATGAAMPAVDLATLDSLLFPEDPEMEAEADGVYRRIRASRPVNSFSKGGEKHINNHNTILTIHKAEYGYVMDSLPFSHPRQLLEMMPVLRQYACLSSILDKSLKGRVQEEGTTEDRTTKENRTVKEDFAAFMKQAKTASQETEPRALTVDVSLYTHPTPSIRLTFPFRKQAADIWFEIAMNGGITIKAQNIISGNVRGETKLTVKKLERMLEITEDLGTFAEFVRSRLGDSQEL